MADNNEKDSCAKDGLPETAYRYKAGVRNSICGNGHNWPTGEGRLAQEKRAAARDLEILQHPGSHSNKEWEEAFRRHHNKRPFTKGYK